MKRKTPRQYSNPSKWSTKLDTPCPLLMPCASCKALLPICDFYETKSQTRRDICGKFRTSICKSCNLQSYTQLDQRKKLLIGARARAQKEKMECSIKKEEIHIPRHCPILGIEIKPNTGKGRQGGLGNPNAPSLDKVIPSKGYISGNICVISALANKLKNDGLEEEFLAILLYMLSPPKIITGAQEVASTIEIARRIIEDITRTQTSKSGEDEEHV